MKKDRIIYWVSTSLTMLLGGISGFLYLTMPAMNEGFKHLGFSDHLRIELGIAKIIGLLIMLVPSVPARIKEWAYAGFGITFISAFVAHTAVDGISTAIMPLVAFGLLSVSYVYFHKVQDYKVTKLQSSRVTK